MSDQVDLARNRVIEELRSHSIDATPITESSKEGEKRPDVLVQDAFGPILIEVKTKLDADGYLAAMERQINTQGHVVQSDRLKRLGAYSHVLDDAVDQLNAHADAPRALKLAWIECAGLDENDQHMFWRYTAYGIGCVVDFAIEGRPSSGNGIFDIATVERSAHECDYFFESDFHKYRNGLDGVLLAKSRDRTLLVNDRSPNATRALASCIATRVATTVVEPVSAPWPGKRYLADCETDRADNQKTLEYIATKYGLGDPRVVPMQRHRIVMRPAKKAM